jgi:hypothetical protein
MKNKKLEVTKKLLEAQGDKPEIVNATIELIKINDKEEKMNAIRSWIAVITGIMALIISTLVAIFNISEVN